MPCDSTIRTKLLTLADAEAAAELIGATVTKISARKLLIVKDGVRLELEQGSGAVITSRLYGQERELLYALQRQNTETKVRAELEVQGFQVNREPEQAQLFVGVRTRV